MVSTARVGVARLACLADQFPPLDLDLAVGEGLLQRDVSPVRLGHLVQQSPRVRRHGGRLEIYQDFLIFQLQLFLLTL